MFSSVLISIKLLSVILVSGPLLSTSIFSSPVVLICLITSLCIGVQLCWCGRVIFYLKLSGLFIRCLIFSWPCCSIYLSSPKFFYRLTSMSVTVFTVLFRFFSSLTKITPTVRSWTWKIIHLKSSTAPVYGLGHIGCNAERFISCNFMTLKLFGVENYRSLWLH